MISLFYVSRSSIAPGNEQAYMAEIVAGAQRRNMTLGVTGALVSIDGLFGQILEGPEAAVNQLVVAILKDGRHSAVKIIEIAPIAERRFASWGMAYVPPSENARALLRALADQQTDGDPRAAIDELVDHMVQGAGSSVQLG